MKANRASQLNDGGENKREIAWKETESSGVKRIWGSQLKSKPQKEGYGSSDSEEGHSMS